MYNVDNAETGSELFTMLLQLCSMWNKSLIINISCMKETGIKHTHHIDALLKESPSK